MARKTGVKAEKINQVAVSDSRNPFVGIAGVIGGISIAIIAIFAIFSRDQMWVTILIVLALAVLGMVLGHQAQRAILKK